MTTDTREVVCPSLQLELDRRLRAVAGGSASRDAGFTLVKEVLTPSDYEQVVGHISALRIGSVGTRNLGLKHEERTLLNSRLSFEHANGGRDTPR